MLKKIRKIICIIAIIIMLPILFVSAVILIDSYVHPDDVPSFFGWKPFIVLTNSMHPVISEGDLVIVKEQDYSNLKVGDIIAFKEGDVVITHRIARMDTEDGNLKIYTKGDYNADIDEGYVTIEQVEGIYVDTISGLGNVAMFVQTPIGMVCCLSIPIGLLIIYSIVDRVKSRKLEAEEESENEKLRKEIEELKKEKVGSKK